MRRMAKSSQQLEQELAEFLEANRRIRQEDPEVETEIRRELTEARNAEEAGAASDG